VLSHQSTGDDDDPRPKSRLATSDRSSSNERGRSAAVRRVTAVINAMSRNPEEPYRLSELSSQLEISPATLHSLVTTLCDVGWLVRHPADKTFSLGPQLIVAGRSAERSFPALRLAESEAHSLAERFGVTCTVSAEVGDVVRVVATARSTRSGSQASITNEVPLCAPFGAPFVAWRSQGDIDEWFDRAPVPLPMSERDEILQALADLRIHGVSVERLTDFIRLQDLVAAAGSDVSEAMRSRLVSALPELTQRRTLLWSELNDSASPPPLGMVFGPIGDATGRVILNLGLHVRVAEPPPGFGVAVCEAVAAAANRAMEGVGGRLGLDRRTNTKAS